MLASFTPVAALAVADLDRARQFYEGVLGLGMVEDMDEGFVFGSGDGRIFVYRSAYAGTNKATAVIFPVPGDAIADVIDQLRSAGISFDTFEMAGVEWTDGVATVRGGRSVWFQDPDGNTLNVSEL